MGYYDETGGGPNSHLSPSGTFKLLKKPQESTTETDLVEQVMPSPKAEVLKGLKEGFSFSFLFLSWVAFALFGIEWFCSTWITNL